MITTEEKTLAKLFANKFIARPDLRAVQFDDGHYEPERPTGTNPRFPQQRGFDLTALVNHIRGDNSYGHYMINPADDSVKLFAFDVDLKKPDPMHPEELLRLPTEQTDEHNWTNFVPGNPRELWATRRPGPARNFLKYQMRFLAHELTRWIGYELEIPAVAAYSGCKGIHVYGFTGRTSAELARKGATIVLEAIGTWQPAKGNNFFRYVPESDVARTNPFLNFEQFDLELYPKQNKATDTGNLMRLPLGRNKKSPDPTFFIDLRTKFNDLAPRKPIEALTTHDQWQ